MIAKRSTWQFFSLLLALGAMACSSETATPAAGSGGRSSGGTPQAGGSMVSGGGRAEGGSAAGGAATGGSVPGLTGGAAGAGTGGKGGTMSASAGAGGTSMGSAGSTGSGGVASGTGGGPGSGGTASPDGGLAGSGGRTTGAGGQGGAGGQTGTNPDGSTATGGSGGSGGSTAYNPCKASPCKILPLGDSITHGYGSTDDAGYRSQLFKLIVAANQNVTFTGSQSNGPSQVSGKTFPKNHEGHDGYTVESGYSTYGTPGISSLIPSPAFNTVPDIVLLHIGTNDLTSSNAKSTTADRLDTELGRIVTAAPDALIVVAKLVPLGYGSSDWDNYNTKIPTIVQAHAAKGQHVISVDMSKLPTSQLNGVHPTDQGYATMAGIWYAAIKDLLPK